MQLTKIILVCSDKLDPSFSIIRLGFIPEDFVRQSGIIVLFSEKATLFKYSSASRVSKRQSLATSLFWRDASCTRNTFEHQQAK
jgi:hypothetical protein